ncbi:hypothetical protein MKX03_017600 [Papaver bracteatum]|nr:hypothetical protein MKX03_017600 [Papaver bracteatum]
MKCQMKSLGKEAFRSECGKLTVPITILVCQIYLLRYCFAYGQTNSGKSHTMRGSVSEPGVIPLAVCDLFHTIQEDMDREFLLRMLYMEIHNEEIND